MAFVVADLQVGSFAFVFSVGCLSRLAPNFRVGLYSLCFRRSLRPLCLCGKSALLSEFHTGR